MGSLKDEMRGLREDHKPCEKTDDEERPGGTDGSTEPDEPQEPELHMDASHLQESDPKSKDRELPEGSKESMTQQPEDDVTAAHITTTVSFLNNNGETSKDKKCDHDREKEEENILVPVPATPGPSDPRSPAPSGQQHMRTQVSLEVVQCCSAATSPMTPPEDGHSFFFPSSFGKSGAVGADTKDAELQVGKRVEFCSVATSPMTPKTPSTTAFPELTGRETVKKSETQSDQQESFPMTKSLEEAKITAALKCNISQEEFSSNTTPESSDYTAAGLKVSQETLGDSNQQSKQLRMGSMDQDITILVTHYGNNGEEGEETAESSLFPIETEMVKMDEYEEPRETGDDDEKETASSAKQDVSNATPPQNQSSETKTEVGNSEVDENREQKDVTKPHVPESPAPFGCHNIRTQVSLEVVQCQSVATSPMTPPEGDHAFHFPSSLGGSGGVGTETKDAELQVGQQVEFRSVATAPMTPRTPTVTVFPDVVKEASTEEKIVEEEEDKKEQVEEEKVTDEKKVEADEDDTNEAINCKEKGEEPVQEVSWDEKGMTWEVYGAVVEVAVLGSAIQKHLEKQVKKQKPSMPPPPPLNPSAVPLSPESIQGGSGSTKSRPGKRGEDGEENRRRRNPFRQLMENIQQPHCCSGAHTTE